MDPANASEDTGVMIALLPITTDWCKLELPHLTLVYCGTTDDLEASAFAEISKDAGSIAMMSTPIMLRVMGVEMFGGGDQPSVQVLKLQPTPELWAMRRTVEKWNASQYPFSPHCTIGPPGSYMSGMELPSALAFDRVFVGYGSENLTFLMKGARGSSY